MSPGVKLTSSTLFGIASALFFLPRKAVGERSGDAAGSVRDDRMVTYPNTEEKREE